MLSRETTYATKCNCDVFFIYSFNFRQQLVFFFFFHKFTYCWAILLGSASSGLAAYTGVPFSSCHSPVPNLPSSLSMAHCSCPTKSRAVRMPRLCSSAVRFFPIPGISDTGMPARKRPSCLPGTTVVPSGLLDSEAILASVLVQEMPIDTVMPSSVLTASRISSAIWRKPWRYRRSNT